MLLHLHRFPRMCWELAYHALTILGPLLPLVLPLPSNVLMPVFQPQSPLPVPTINASQ